MQAFVSALNISVGMVTPLLSCSLEAYSALMNECSDVLLSRLHAAAADNAELDIWRVLGDLTMHVVGSAAFGCGQRLAHCGTACCRTSNDHTVHSMSSSRQAAGHCFDHLGNAVATRHPCSGMALH